MVGCSGGSKWWEGGQKAGHGSVLVVGSVDVFVVGIILSILCDGGVKVVGGPW